MDNQLEGVRWVHHEVAVYEGLDLVSLRMFRDQVVGTALGALDRRIDALRASEHLVERTFAAESVADLWQATIEGFLLTTQSMHERGLRSLMYAMGTRLGWEQAKCLRLRKAAWSDGAKDSLQSEFERLFGARIHLFGDYGDLDLLWTLGNAIRHGEGQSVKRLHDLWPSLWTQRLVPGMPLPGGRVVPDNVPSPPFSRITLPRALLDQMIETVFGFWEDIEFVRCNSWMREETETEAFKAIWRQARRARELNRAWP